MWRHWPRRRTLLLAVTTPGCAHQMAEGGEIKEPIDIGGGFSMEEIKDGAEANAAMDNV